MLSSAFGMLAALLAVVRYLRCDVLHRLPGAHRRWAFGGRFRRRSGDIYQMSFVAQGMRLVAMGVGGRVVRFIRRNASSDRTTWRERRPMADIRPLSAALTGITLVGCYLPAKRATELNQWWRFDTSDQAEVWQGSTRRPPRKPPAVRYCLSAADSSTLTLRDCN